MEQKAVLPKKKKERNKMPIKNIHRPISLSAAARKYNIFFFLAVGVGLGILSVSGYQLAKKSDKIAIVSGDASFSISSASSVVCGTDTVSDIDSNIYNTVKIGDQCWLRQNLRVTKNPQGDAITRYCYDNDIDKCNVDGGFYDWNTAMNRSAAEGAQGICPNGWHIPRDGEWHILENYLKDIDQGCNADRIGQQDCEGAGKKLALGGTSGFEGRLSGYLHKSGTYYGRDRYTFFWSSTESEPEPESDTGIFGRFLSKDYSTLYRSFDERAENFSIRCIKD